MNHNLALWILLIMGLASCNVSIKELKISTQKEKVKIEGSIQGSKVDVNYYFIGNMPWFKSVCKKNNIQQHVDIINDTTINFSLDSERFTDINNLISNISNGLDRGWCSNCVEANFYKSDSTFHLRMKVNAEVFIANSRFTFSTKEGGLMAIPSKNDTLVDIFSISDNDVTYEFNHAYIDTFKSAPFRRFYFEYPNVDYESKKSNSIRKLLSYLFEEHLWVTISAILTSIISFVTIMGYFKRK